MKPLWFALPLLLAPGAASAQTADSTVVRPCTAIVAGADLSGWKEVRGNGFTFCVPASWRPFGRARNGADAPTWRGGSGSVTWGRGEPPRAVVTTVVTTTVVSGPMRSVPPTPPRSESRTFSEVIGGSSAELWTREYDGRHANGAQWHSPRGIYLTGESRDPGTAADQLRVYRTVRFTQP